MLLVPALARAEVDFGVEVGVGHSDNITRVDGNETDETMATAGFDLLWQESTSRLDADVDVDLSYVEYLDDSYDSEVVGSAAGTVIATIIPDRFTWLFQDSFGQTRSDPFAPVTPDNRENLNYFTTGPDLIFRLGSQASASLFGRYATTNYEDSPLDAERTSGGLALARRPSARSELALNAVTERIRFDDLPDADYDRRNASFSYTLEGARTEVSAEAGYTWIEKADGDETGGALLRLSVARDLSPSSTLRLSAGSEFTDAGESLRSSLEAGGAAGADITASADPFENRFASVDWQFARNRTGLTLGVRWDEDRYEEQTLLDRTRLAYHAAVFRRMARTLEFEVHAQLHDEEFDSTALQVDELTFGTSLTWRPGRTLSYSLTLDRYDRDTSNGTGEYVEHRAFLTVTYRPRGPARGPAARR